MPSRVRAFLYNDNVEQLIIEMTDSMQNLLNFGCNRIILACNTSNIFLPRIYTRIPELEKYVVIIIESCVNNTKSDNNKSIYLLGSERTIDSKVYQKALSTLGIDCIVLKSGEYIKLRRCIEAVKQNKYSDEIKYIFLDVLNHHKSCILGCAELPILYEKYRSDIVCERVYDPVLLALQNNKKEFSNE